MKGKENELMSKDGICLWYVDWSGTIKLTNLSYLLSLFYSILLYQFILFVMKRMAKLSSLLIFQVFDSIFIIN